MRVLVRGGGDLASGIIIRLYKSGHEVIVTEIETPLTVRREVAFSKAVYEKKCTLEGITCVRIEDPEDVETVLRQKMIPLIIDPEAKIRKHCHPDVLVDATLAKKNLGTTIYDAEFVICVGPGFTAGIDCHCVIETKRGPHLGRVYWEGSAIPNTGIPGNVAGFTIERLIKATADGLFQPVAKIGDFVQKGDVVAYSGGEPVYALMSGCIRGMLQDDVMVKKGLKVGDIDARLDKELCVLVSDKARAVGGGVLEAISAFEHSRRNYGIVILAAGASSRFGKNKLVTEYKGKPLFLHIFEKIKNIDSVVKVVVSGTDEILRQADAYGFLSVKNDNPQEGITRSLRLGLMKCMNLRKDLRGILFCVCDQPEITEESFRRIFMVADIESEGIVCAGVGNRKGNPVYFDRAYFSELLMLSGDTGGRQVMKAHPDKIRICQISEKELKDVDTQADLEQFEKE